MSDCSECGGLGFVTDTLDCPKCQKKDTITISREDAIALTGFTDKRSFQNARANLKSALANSKDR